jgi:hypothetical protein
MVQAMGVFSDIREERTMRTEEFGMLATRQEQMQYAMLQELREIKLLLTPKEPVAEKPKRSKAKPAPEAPEAPEVIEDESQRNDSDGGE